MLLALQSLNMIYHDISFHVKTVALIIQGKYGLWLSGKKFTSNRVEKLCIIAYTITSGIFM